MMNANMSPIDWAKRPIKKYADFTGRAPRAEYWWYALALLVVFLVVNIVENLVGLGGMVGAVYGPLFVILWLATIVPNIAVGVRRLHDTDRSGWWLLLCAPYGLATAFMVQSVENGGMSGLGTAAILSAIGFICAIVLLVFMVLPGTSGPNRFGPDPYGRSEGVAEA